MKDYILRYGKREHRGLLQDSLETSCYITEQKFKHLLNDYVYYGFDDRCNQLLFINTEKEFVWLFIEIMNIYEFAKAIEQKLKKFAIDYDICSECLKKREKPCVFYDNNDEHLCDIILDKYTKFK